MSAEPRFRRAQQVTPRSSRNLPGMPPEVDDPDDDAPRPRRRFDEPKRPWWRPVSRVGRVLIAAGALTILGGLFAIYITAARFLEHDPRFRIAGTSAIQATGLSQVSRAELLPVFGADIGKNIFFVHLSERRRQLEHIPWVEHATVMRLLPDQIHVSIVERKPVAFVREGQQIELVDGNGVLLTMSPAAMARHHYSFPVVTGIDANSTPEARRTRMAVYQRLISDLDSTGQHLSAQLSEIDLSDPEDARVLMPEQGADILAHFGDEQFLTRYQRYKAHIAEWRAQYPKLASVDLRYDQQVVLQMTADAGGAQASVSSGAANAPTATETGKPSAGTEAAAVTAKRETPAVKKHAAAAHKAHAVKTTHKSVVSKKNRRRAELSRAGLKHHAKHSTHSSTTHLGQ